MPKNSDTSYLIKQLEQFAKKDNNIQQSQALPTMQKTALPNLNEISHQFSRPQDQPRPESSMGKKQDEMNKTIFELPLNKTPMSMQSRNSIDNPYSLLKNTAALTLENSRNIPSMIKTPSITSMDAFSHHTPIMMNGPGGQLGYLNPHQQNQNTSIIVPTPGGGGYSTYPELRPQLQNIVSTVNLDCPLNLRQIALHARNAEYNPKRFAAVIMRIREPKTTALIFASGKMVCTGAKSEDESYTAARRYAKVIKKLKFKVSFIDFKIQNIVGSSNVRFPIRLEGLSHSHAKFCTYEPDIFPGLIYRMQKPKIVLLIFVSGKIVLTGAKNRKDIDEAFDKIYAVLYQHRKTT